MPEIPAFFVPFAEQQDPEVVFRQCAQRCSRPVPPLSERIYSITFLSDSDEWIATVGQPLRGTHRTFTGRGTKRREHLSSVSDPAVVIAIFPGTPFKVLTNEGPVHQVHSAWENPFMAGSIQAVTRFATPA